MNRQPVWFGPADRPLFGMLGRPVGAQCTDVGVLLCPPLGIDARATYRVYSKLADELNARGITTLRFDYDGTGDSAGSADDPGRVEAWLASVGHAADRLRAAGATTVLGLGMRLGATIVCAAARNGSVTDLRGLILWDPCASGRAFLREQRALSAQLGGESGTGAVDVPEYYFTPDVVANVESGLGPLDPPDGVPVLLLTRTDRPVAKDVRALVERAGVAQAAAEDQSRLLDVSPEDAQIPEAAVDRVLGWICAYADRWGRLVTVPTDAAAGRTRLLTPAGVPVIEEAGWLAEPGLFGIRTTPADRPVAREVVVMINVATEHRIGPARAWVELARELAGSGLRSIRLELSGIGESLARDGQQRDIMYSPEWLADLPALLDSLAPAPVILVGLCSGAYSAIEVALRRRVCAVYAVNPRFDHDSIRPGAAQWHPDRLAARSMPAPLRRLAVEHSRPARWIWRALRELHLAKDPADPIYRTVAAGTDLMLIATPDDAAHYRDTALHRHRLGRRDTRFELRVIDGLHHSLHHAAGRREVVRTIASDLTDRYGTVLYPTDIPTPERQL